MERQIHIDAKPGGKFCWRSHVYYEKLCSDQPLSINWLLMSYFVLEKIKYLRNVSSNWLKFVFAVSNELGHFCL